MPCKKFVFGNPEHWRFRAEEARTVADQMTYEEARTIMRRIANDYDRLAKVAGGWFGVAAPKNTPTEIIDKLNKQINVALTEPRIKARIADLGGTVFAGLPSDFSKFIAEETEKWAKVVKFSGAKPEG